MSVTLKAATYAENEWFLQLKYKMFNFLIWFKIYIFNTFAGLIIATNMVAFVT